MMQNMRRWRVRVILWHLAVRTKPTAMARARVEAGTIRTGFKILNGPTILATTYYGRHSGVATLLTASIGRIETSQVHRRARETMAAWAFGVLAGFMKSILT